MTVENHLRWQPMPQEAEALRSTVDEFCQFISKLPPAALEEKAWGPKEVLAHLEFWHQSFVSQAEAIVTGNPLELPQGRFGDISMRVVAASRNVSVEALLYRFQAANKRLCDFSQKHDPERIMLVLKKGSVARTLKRVMIEEADHIRTHHRILVQQANYDAQNAAEQLGETVQAFCYFVGQLSKTNLNNYDQEVGEILAELVLCHESYVARIEAILNETLFVTPSTKDLKAHAVKLSHTPTNKLLHRFYQADEKLRNFCQKLDIQSITMEMLGGADLRTLDDVISRIEANIRKHHRRLRKRIITLTNGKV